MANHPNRSKRWEVCTRTSSGDELVAMRAKTEAEAIEMADAYQKRFPRNAVWVRDGKISK